MSPFVFRPRDLEFAEEVLDVFRRFRYHDLPYLTYLRRRTKNDQNLIWDQVVKPLLQVLGYDHRVFELVAEEPHRLRFLFRSPGAVCLEVQSSLLVDFAVARKELLKDASRIGADVCVLTDGVRLELWQRAGRRKLHVLRAVVHLDEIYQQSVIRGVRRMPAAKLEEILALRTLSRRAATA